MTDFRIGHAVSWSIRYLQSYGQVDQSQISGTMGNGNISNSSTNNTHVRSGDMGGRSSEISSSEHFVEKKIQFAKWRLSNLAKSDKKDADLIVLKQLMDKYHQVDYKALSKDLKSIFCEVLKNYKNREGRICWTRICA